EGERHARAVGYHEVRPVARQEPHGEHEVSERVSHVARGRVVRPHDVLTLEQRAPVGQVERHPGALVLLPPRLQLVKLDEMAARRADEHDPHSSSRSRFGVRVWERPAPPTPTYFFFTDTATTE